MQSEHALCSGLLVDNRQQLHERPWYSRQRAAATTRRSEQVGGHTLVLEREVSPGHLPRISSYRTRLSELIELAYRYQLEFMTLLDANRTILVRAASPLSRLSSCARAAMQTWAHDYSLFARTL